MTTKILAVFGLAATAKVRALFGIVATSFLNYISWLATIPPEQQSGILSQLVEVTPVQYRPTVAWVTKTASVFFAIYAVYNASHSGPQSPPANQPK